MLKKIKEKGFLIDYVKDITFLQYDYSATVGLNTIKKESFFLPELILIGIEKKASLKIIKNLAYNLLKGTIPIKPCIVNNLIPNSKIKIMLHKINDVNYFKTIELKKAFHVTNKLCARDVSDVYQIILSNEEGIFDFSEIKEIHCDMVEGLDNIDFALLPIREADNVSQSDFEFLLKASQFLSNQNFDS